MKPNKSKHANTIISESRLDNTKPSIHSDKINRAKDRYWYYQDEVNQKKGTIDWNSAEIQSQHMQVAKEFIHSSFNEGIPNGMIYCRSKTLKNEITVLRLFFSSIKKLNIVCPLSKLNYQQIKNIAQTMLIKQNGELYSRGRADYICTLLKKSHSYYLSGKTSDGISIDLPENLRIDLFQNLVEGHGLNYQQWDKGGNWNTLGAQPAIHYLSDIIEKLDSPKTKFLRSFFRFQRSTQAIDTKYLFCGQNSSVLDYILITRSQKASDDKKTHAQKILKSRHRHKVDAFGDQLSSLARIFEEHNITKVPRAHEVSDWANDCIDFCITGIALLTGARISEIRSIKPNSVKYSESRGYTFDSEIHKTHRGHIYTRSVTGYVSDLVNICLDLSYLDKIDLELSPFSRTITEGFGPPTYGKNNYISKSNKETLSYSITRSYLKWLDTLPSTVRAKYPNSTSPHALRHVFAELALRRFDGQVHEKIRRHFMHTYGSPHTKKYIEEKLESDIKAKTEKAYIREIVQKIYEGNHEYYGPVVKTITTMIDNSHKVVSPEQAETFLDEISNNFVDLVPHEYGYCMTSSKAIALAQCVDPITGLADPLERSSIKNCTKCVHRLTHKSHKASLMNIGISHQSFIDNSPLPHITEASKIILKQINAALEEIDKPRTLA